MIAMKNPIVEIDGDEMTRVLWAVVKERLLAPHIALNAEYYDLSLENRDKTGDQVTAEAAQAILRHKVAVKCATITPNEARQKEYSLRALYASPNATIRATLDGTVFRKPIVTPLIAPAVSAWKAPIAIGRHAYGDVYKAAEMLIPGAGIVELVYTAPGGKEKRLPVAALTGPGIVQAMYNYDESIINFARACFLYALGEHLDVWFAAKDTISKVYDGRFKELFARVYNEEFKAKCDAAGISYFYTLIDDAVARVMHSKGGFLWACKNYDGDVMSDMVASASGSLAMMTSVLVSPAGVYEYEAAHGTVQKHYYRYKAGEKTSTNPVALIFAWTGALKKRGELDGDDEGRELAAFADRLEAATMETIAGGVMTADLARLTGRRQGDTPVKPVNSWQFIDAIASRL